MLQADEPSITVEATSDGSLLIRIAGGWSIHRSPPTSTEVIARLAQGATAKSVRFDFSGLQAWGSSLVSCVVAVAMRCRELKTPLETQGLPEGVDRLLKMALAVLEQHARPAP